MRPLASHEIIAVIGAGTMGMGIAQVASKAGHSVLLFDKNDGAVTKGLQSTRDSLQKLVTKRRITMDESDALLARIQPVSSLDALAPAALVVEAVVEDLAIKQQLFSELEAICSEDTILASNTSSLSITAIASKLQNPDRLVGMHFFNPAPIMKLVEVVSGISTKKTIAQKVFATAVAWGKQAVFARSTPGFIVNRIARPFYAESLRVLEEGGSNVATIDAIMRESGGFPMGPFELMDLIGHDVNYAVTSSVFVSYYGDQRFTPSLLQKELIDAGFLGRKTGRGFYRYDTAENTDVSNAEKFAAPQSVVFSGKSSFSQTLIDLVRKTSMTLELRDSSEEFSINVGAACMQLSDGRLATQRAEEERIDNLIVFDLAFDYATAPRIAMAATDQASDKSVQDAIAFWQALGKQVSVLDDIAGLCVLRSVSMLANEGADAVNQGVCDVASVDLAMCAGLNYPQGPMAWSDTLGLRYIATTLGHLHSVYGDNRYRLSPLIHRLLLAKKSFYQFERKAR